MAYILNLFDCLLHWHWHGISERALAWYLERDGFGSHSEHCWSFAELELDTYTYTSDPITEILIMNHE